MATTNGFGTYTAQLAASTSAGGDNVTATVGGTSPAGTASADFTVVGGVSIGVSPQSVPVGGTAKVSGVVTGGSATVDITLSSGGGSAGAGSISPATVASDVYGNWSAEFTAPDRTGAVTVTATVYGAAYQAQTVILITPLNVTVDGVDQATANGGTATASYGNIRRSDRCVRRPAASPKRCGSRGGRPRTDTMLEESRGYSRLAALRSDHACEFPL